MEEDKLYCPNCGSSQLTANKKGFGAGKAIGGAILTGGIGLVAGFIGSDSVKITCLKCGCTWKLGQLKTTPLSKSQKQECCNRPQIKKQDSHNPENFIVTGLMLVLWLCAVIAILISCIM